MMKFRLLRLVNEDSAIGYDYLLMSVNSQTSIEFFDNNHLSISSNGYNKNDIENIIEDYEVTNNFIELDTDVLINKVIKVYGLPSSDISLIYYFEDKSLNIAWGYNHSYCEKEVIVNSELAFILEEVITKITKLFN